MRDYDSVQLIGSLAKGLTVLEILLEKGSVGVTELSKYLSVNKSSAFRLLVTLESKGFVEQERDTGKYRLGLKMAKFQMQSLNNYALRDRAEPFLDMLCKETNETCGLCVLIDNEPVIIDKRNSPLFISTNLKIGDVVPVHCTAMGRALISNLPKEDILAHLERKPLEQYTQYTETNIENICRILEKESASNSIVESEEHSMGMCCIAGKIRDYTGKVVAAVGVSAPVERLSGEKLTETQILIDKISSDFSRVLGY